MPLSNGIYLALILGIGIYFFSITQAGGTSCTTNTFLWIFQYQTCTLIQPPLLFGFPQAEVLAVLAGLAGYIIGDKL